LVGKTAKSIVGTKDGLNRHFFDFRSKFNNYYAIRKLISKEKCNNQHPLYIYITNPWIIKAVTSGHAFRTSRHSKSLHHSVTSILTESLRERFRTFHKRIILHLI